MRIGLTTLAVLVSTLFAVTGCLRTGLAIHKAMGGAGLEDRMKLQHPETGRQIVMLGMIHLEKPQFFDEIRHYLDSLKRDGYVVFHEGVKGDGIDSLRLDTLLRKFRRVTGVYLTEFYDNISVGEKHVIQSTSMLGLNTPGDILVDTDYDELITEYEKRYGEILLSDYDLRTPLTQKYKRRKAGKEKYSKYNMIYTIREDHIAEAVRNSPHQKIVLLYGKGHWYGLYPYFRDAGFQITEGKL
jgi:hypothetical protein